MPFKHANHFIYNSYTPAKITVVAVAASSILLTSLLRVLYGVRNARADRAGGPARSFIERQFIKSRGLDEDAEEEEGADFRYSY